MAGGRIFTQIGDSRRVRPAPALHRAASGSRASGQRAQHVRAEGVDGSIRAGHPRAGTEPTGRPRNARSWRPDRPDPELMAEDHDLEVLAAVLSAGGDEEPERTLGR